MNPGQWFFGALEGEQKRRPLIVISQPVFNRGGYVVVVPVTSSRYYERSRLPNCVPFAAGQSGFDRDCVAQAENITLIHAASLEPEPAGVLDERKHRELIRAIGYVLGADCEPSA